MRTLDLLRHAKSDWDAGVDNDWERPLNRRGRGAADLVGRCLARIAVPDLVLCSSAVRTRETLERALAAGGLEPRVEIVDALYGATPMEVVELCRQVDDSVTRLLVVGHEPTMSALVGGLVGSARVQMPTATLASLELVGPWSSLAADACELRWLHQPKSIARLLESPDR